MSQNINKEKMSAVELFKRYVLLLIGLFFSAFGVALTKRAELGVSPISSVANVMSIRFSALSIGSWLIIWNCVLIVGQILVLRRKFSPIQLLQIPLSFVFGWFTDLGMVIASMIKNDVYAVRILLVFIGTAVLGFGIALSVIADVIMNSGEAFVKALADTLSIEFGTVKIVFDIACVVLSLILSLLFFEFTIKGAREGTVIAAFCTGWAVKLFMRLLKRPVSGLLISKKADKPQ